MSILIKTGLTALVLFIVCYWVYQETKNDKFNAAVAVTGVASFITLITCALIAIWQS